MKRVDLILRKDGHGFERNRHGMIYKDYEIMSRKSESHKVFTLSRLSQKVSVSILTSLNCLDFHP